ncbi:peptidoglycan-binding protein [Mesorhizobium sp. 1B3]|uniref:peptidoglycan-binding protein n=1 Tax=Mesorhizobium sp. 1B3 TaxID=3243599 RepID=UPI003D9599FB
MNSKRSYLDSLNVGRPRKAHASLEELNRSLEDIESRLERGGAGFPRGTDASRSQGADDRRTSSGERRQDDRYRSSGPTYQEIARDIDRVRGQEEGVASVGRIASELKGLREELRHQMTAGLRREFDTLRNDIERAYAASPATSESTALGAEFDRLSDAIHSLAGRSDDRGVHMLRLELEQVRNSLDLLAREETVRSADRHWEEFDRRWSHIEDRLAGNSTHNDDPALAALNRRLQEITEAVHNLPESLCLRSLEEKVRVLATAVDHFASQQDRRDHQTFQLIEERLDEISRAIVASTAMIEAPHFDPAPFERIEARIASLARQVEELIEDRPSVEVIDRLALLSQRVDQIAAHRAVPEKSLERLARQVSAIAEKIDSGPAAPEADHILRGIEDRFIMLSDMLDRRQGDAIEHGQALFRDLERRLEDVAARLDERRSGFDDVGIMDAIDARFAELARRLDIDRPGPGDEAMRHMEARLEEISARLESSAAHVAAIDPELIRSLEAQVSGLSAHLARPVAPLPDFEDIAPRLDEIEQSIAGQRDAILEAARQAAENAVRTLADSPSDSAAVAGLAEDLRSLETLTRHSDERNTRTFEAIHDTLLKIVDRLGALEHRSPAPPSQPPEPRKMAVNAAPSIQPDAEEDFAFVALDPGQDNGARTPHEAAAAAAAAAMGAHTAEETGSTGLVRSMFGGLGRAFFAREEKASTSPAAAAPPRPEAPTLDLDEPLDPSIANRPLEPGSGAPDLNAIMRRVRDERGQTPRHTDNEAAKSDFIAAARRAAQAAAAEAGSMKASDMSGQRSSFGLGEFLRRKRKSILMGTVAIVLALGAMQLGRALLADDEQLANGDAFTIEPASTTADTPNARPAEPVVASTAPQAPRSAASDDMPTNDGAPESRTAETPVAAEPDIDASMPTSSIDRSDDRMSATEAAPPIVTPFTEPNASEAKAAFEPAPADAGPAPLREAADAGNPKAMFEIGSRYAEGRGVKDDMAAAAKWYERAAELGFAPAQYRIGNFYEKGLGVTRDIAKAKTWYQLAAAQGNASAMHNLAVLFAMGADGVADNDSAARWFIEAAELGVKDSQFNLGILAAKGIGMPQNLEESYKWFALVAKTGDQDASTKRDEVAKMLRPEQLERARAAAELWKPKTAEAAANAVDIPASWQDGPVKTASVDMKKAVANIQKILNKNGYDAGGADGVMGEKTKTAIAAFQKDNGMDPTGRVDESLVKALIERK